MFRVPSIKDVVTRRGPETFMSLITSPGWRFIPDQWGVQTWTRVFARIPMENFTYCALHITARDAAILSGKDGNLLLPTERLRVCKSLCRVWQESRARGRSYLLSTKKYQRFEPLRGADSC
ncbi:MAG: hypothetical protein AB1700_02525 [Bacillota bacterium]